MVERPMQHPDVHFLRSARLDRRAVDAVEGPKDAFPLGLRWIQDLDLEFTTPVTFFIGENGSGKSTLLEALAERSGLPAGGGSRAETGVGYTPENQAALTPFLLAGFRRKPRDGYFFRAEHQAHLAALLEEREQDPDFYGDPYRHYGGKSLLVRSHGEAFLELMGNRLQAGLFLMDEPEAALSPARQLSLLALIADRVDETRSQFVVATHSPILLTYPGATILSFDEGALRAVELEETDHYQITRDILANPEKYWKHLRP
jgi:predicted ATPase